MFSPISDRLVQRDEKVRFPAPAISLWNDEARMTNAEGTQQNDETLLSSSSGDTDAE
jgi:hypothetical protein